MTADVLDAQQITQHHQKFSIQMLRHQVSGVDRVTDVFDPELLVLLSAAAKSTLSPCV